MYYLTTARRRALSAGFTLLELIVVITIMGVVTAVGFPKMTTWLMTSKASAAGEFYMEGVRTARQMAVANNAQSRLVLTPNATTGQYDWQVDICFSVPPDPANPNGTPCVTKGKATGSWSTTAAAAAGAPAGATSVMSVFRSALMLPKTNVVKVSLSGGVSPALFTQSGWLDTTSLNNLNQINIDPAGAYVGVIPSNAVKISIGGMPTLCDPSITDPNSGDSRKCPP